MAKRKPNIELHLMDDNYNTFETVIDVLNSQLPRCSTIRAEQIATLTHYHGSCHIYTGKGPEVWIIQSNLIKRGLLVKSRPKSKKL